MAAKGRSGRSNSKTTGLKAELEVSDIGNLSPVVSFYIRIFWRVLRHITSKIPNKFTQ